MTVELTVKILWCLFGVVVVYMATQLGIGEFSDPGPGLMSMIFGLAMAVVAGGSVLLDLFVRTPQGASEPWTREMLMRIGGIVVALAVYVALLEPLGFLLATFALSAFLLWLFTSSGWLRAIPAGAAIAFANYALFKLALGTQLPIGILG
ncbi:MAG TPA: tripartite tricarboxylate transporter TctB family protein [Rhizobiaceae bacterium]|nr:tripartite tricarboxylate transporter TctB family protein [Rhizobiaceae bacterium]